MDSSPQSPAARVFLSYGHDANAPLVHRIRDDLERAGHEVWIDSAEIRFSQDWRRKILDGIKAADWMLAFLSKHSARDPGVCLDEIGIALGELGGAIATVLVEAEGEVRAPVSISHIQWLDMHDWAERQRADPAAFGRWYVEKLAAIRAVIESDAARHFAGEIQELSDRLRPLRQDADIAPLIDGFTGRAWLLEALERWRRDETAPRLFWLTGPPGSGKSAFAAWITHFGRANVIGLNLCRYNLDERRNPLRVIRTLAFQAATRLADYRRLLLEQLRRDAAAGKKLDDIANAADLFDMLLVQPLHRCIDGGRRNDRYVLVIDALDETIVNGESVLAETLAEQAPKLPPWLALVVTGRPDWPVRRHFEAFGPTWIDAASAENIADLRVYAEGWLGGTPDAAARIARVVAAADGNFQYLRKLRDAVERGLIDLASSEQLPLGLAQLYRVWFRRQFSDAADYETRVLPVVELLAAAERPLPEPILDAAIGWSVRDKARLLESLGSLFERRGGGWAPFHKSLRDWLADPEAAGSAYVADLARGRRHLFDQLWAMFLDCVSAGDAGAVDRFLVDEFPALFLGESQTRLEHAIAADEAAATARLAFASEVANGVEATYAWARALDWWRLITRWASLAGLSPEWRGTSRFREGLILVAMGRPGEALSCYTEARQALESAVAAAPEEVSSRRALAEVTRRLGDLAMMRGNQADAVTAYRSALDMATQLAGERPGSRLRRHDLIRAQRAVGDITRDRGDLKAAIEFYRDSMVAAMQLAERDPDNDAWQAELALGHQRLGSAYLLQANLPFAESAFRRAIEVAARNADRRREDWQWIERFATACMSLADVLSRRDDIAGALDVLKQAFIVSDVFARAHPDNAGAQLLAARVQNRAGEAFEARGQLDDALGVYRMAARTIEGLLRRDERNGFRRDDLADSHLRIATILKEQEKFSEAEAEIRAGIALRQQLLAAEPDNAEWRSTLAASQLYLADILQQGQTAGDAVAACGQAIEALTALAAADPDNLEHWRDLAEAHRERGRLHEDAGDGAAALADREAALAACKRVADRIPDDAEAQADLGAAHHRLAGLLRDRDALDAALDHIQAAVAIRTVLAHAEPDEQSGLKALARSVDWLARVQEKRGDTDAALAAYRQCLTLEERLAAAVPDDADRAEDVALTHNAIGGILAARGDLAGAAASYHASVKIRDALLAKAPESIERQEGLARSCGWFGETRHRMGGDDGLADAVAALVGAVQLRERLFSREPASERRRNSLVHDLGELADAARDLGERHGRIEDVRVELAARERLAALAPGDGRQRDLAACRAALARLSPPPPPPPKVGLFRRMFGAT